MKINKIYGIDYNTYVAGGIGNRKLQKWGEETELFISEKEMLKTLGELKEDCRTGEEVPFVAELVRKDYAL